VTKDRGTDASRYHGAGLELLRCVVQSRHGSLYPYNAPAKLQGDHIRVMPKASQFNKPLVSFSVRSPAGDTKPDGRMTGGRRGRRSS